MALPESRDDAQSPLLRFLKEVSEKLPMYYVAVFVLNAQTFLVFSRVRLWIVFMHRDAGGAEALALMKKLVQAT